ncbi:uncharacterized protein BXZ73DRAFT_106606 [Epithele typhae]|uniref:uncharacterized protein n=1 Tax=Epithele typhae TaxID=378194 RepID=UPI002007A95D|nr:uncharacterized protein BXZ73DRAFT_106606 [Epithele typhae]KAH9914361.1 hypothetical protein BXZ73DRAFT_106606 [Epithele typhae]
MLSIFERATANPPPSTQGRNQDAATPDTPLTPVRNELRGELERTPLFLDSPIMNLPLRRQRSNDDNYSKAQRKRHRDEAKVAATNAGVETEEIMRFADLPSPGHMLINLKIDFTRTLKHMREAHLFKYLMTNDFDILLSYRIQVCFLAPNIPTYLEETNARVANVMRMHPESMSLPSDIHEYAGLFDLAVVKVPNLNSRARGVLRHKILVSLGTKLPPGVKHDWKLGTPKTLSQLALSLVPKNTSVAMTNAHLLRLAVLRQLMTDFFTGLHEAQKCPNHAPSQSSPTPVTGNDDNDNEEGDASGTGSNANEHQFASPTIGDDSQAPPKAPLAGDYDASHLWKYIDAQLNYQRSQICYLFKDKADQTNAWQRYLNEQLQSDLEKYKPKGAGTSPLSIVESTPFPWQETIERAMTWSA